jgi:ribonucleotide monophosphatase NagD (HAD superfamily)
VVSSGDVTMDLLANTSGNVFHLGPNRDLGLVEDTEARFSAIEDARTVLCTGLVDDATETPQDYVDLLQDMRARGVTMICANPDKVVRRGDTLLPCAGALAELYETMGGETVMAGKPFAPIYEVAIERAVGHRRPPHPARRGSGHRRRAVDRCRGRPAQRPGPVVHRRRHPRGRTRRHGP